MFGGKITTYRRLAEHALEKLSPFLGTMRRANKGGPGASRCRAANSRWNGSRPRSTSSSTATASWRAPHAARLVRMYGTRAKDVLGAAQSAADLGRDFGATLTEAEIDYLMREEWAERADDVLWRRSKLGLRLSAEQAAAVDDAMEARRRNAARQPAVAGARP